ncbi:hypothetical protein GGS21DRAFT_499947 [Xylaria nigripes]|nr:hypothetical protein GGS21DRAFT_499947 [Xylaria nigripes]
MAAQPVSTSTDDNMSNDTQKPQPAGATGSVQKSGERQNHPAAKPGQKGNDEKTSQTSSKRVEKGKDDSSQQSKKTSQQTSQEENSEAGKDEPPRHYVTGQMLSKHGRTCLRCWEKGLICTLAVVDKEAEQQCAACRRSKTQYCVRFKPMGEKGEVLPYDGSPWCNPNFVSEPAEGKQDNISVAGLREIILEAQQGPSRYVMGNYVTESDTYNFALPSFKDDHLVQALGIRADDCDVLGWKAVLPLGRRRVWKDGRRPATKKEEKEYNNDALGQTW